MTKLVDAIIQVWYPGTPGISGALPSCPSTREATWGAFV